MPVNMTLIAIKCADESVEVWKDGSVDNQPVMRFAPYLSNKPDYRYKYVMYNCARYNLMWKKPAQQLTKGGN